MFTDDFVIYLYPLKILYKISKPRKFYRVMGSYEPTSMFQSREHYLKSYFRHIGMSSVVDSYIMNPLIILICYITRCADDLLIWRDV